MKQLLAVLLTARLLVMATAGSAAETTGADVEDMPPVMISLADREAPSEEEWDALHDDKQRAGLFGSLGDLKSHTISFMDTQYFTANSAEGTLASYGKMSGKNKFDRYGHIQNIEFDLPTNSWKERYALNAAALLKLTGKTRFIEFAGVELEAAARDRRQIEVTFLGTMAPKDEVIRKLNEDLDALDYLATLYERHTEHKRKTVKLFAGSVPPEPKVILANVIMLDGRSSKLVEGGLEGRAESIIHGIGGGLKLEKNGSEAITLLTPVVRCYRTYSLEFKTKGNGNLDRVVKTDRQGQSRTVPVVFDLTPDL